MKQRTCIAVLCLLALPALGLAQSYLLQGPPAEKGRLTLRYFWPQKGIAEREGPQFLSGLFDLSASFRAGQRWNVIVAVPYLNFKRTYTNWEDIRVSESARGLGNASIAVEMLLDKTEGRHTGLTAGVYLPTLARRDRSDQYWDDPYYQLAEIGVAADYAEFPKALDATTPFARIAHYRDWKNGWHAGLEGGAFLMLPRGGDLRPLYLHYGAAAGKSAGPIRLQAEVRGSVHIAGFVDEVYIRLNHQVALGAEWGQGRLRPGVFYTMFLDRWSREDSSGALCLRLQYEL
jgi:hypothetical protein